MARLGGLRHADGVTGANEGMPDGAAVDFFVSHAGHDRAWAEWVAWHLAEAGYTVELDVWDWATGQNLVTKMSDALDRSGRVVALFSAAYFDRSRYTTEEWSASVIRLTGAAHGRLVPLRIEDVPAKEIPAVLRPLLFRDLYGLSEDDARRVLLEAVAAPTRPDASPVFPGLGNLDVPSRLIRSAPRLPGSLPSVWNVQQRNPAFVGRDAALVEIREHLLTGGTAVARALHGMGGVGKTQLALEYAYRFAGNYELVWWVTAERAELIATQLASLATEAGIAASNVDVPTAIRTLYTDLRSLDQWLLIFDNADDPRALRQWLPGGPGHVLITSRNPNWDEIAAPIDVQVFAAEDAVTLLRRRMPGIARVDAEQLATQLGDLPLALAQAAGVLGETGLSAKMYMEYLADHAADALEMGTPPSYPQSLAATVSDAARRLAEADPAAGTILRLSASLGPEVIPASVFTSPTPGGLPEPFGSMVLKPIAVHQLLGQISRYGLARLDQDGLQVHRLVQAILRDQLPAEQRRQDSECVAALLVATAPADTDDPATWPTWAAILPHLLSADPSHSNNAGLRELAVRALLYLLRRGDSATVAKFGLTLFQQWTSHLGPNHPHSLSAATELAHAHLILGRPVDARILIKDTLARQRRVLGYDHIDTLRSASDLGVALNDLGESQEARALDLDTFARRQRVLGSDDPETLVSAGNLAGVLHGLHELHEASELAKDTLRRRQASLGNDHPSTLHSATTLAFVLADLAELRAARELAQDTLARSRQVLGHDHPDTLSSAESVIGILRRLGELRAVRELAEDTLLRSRRVLGDDHSQALYVAADLVSILVGLGELPAARELADDTLTRRRRVHGDNHPATFHSATDVALVLYGLGETQAARELAESTLARSRQIFGDDHLTTLRSADMFVGTLLGLGDWRAARELAEDTLARLQQILGHDHPDAIGSASHLVEALIGLRDWRAARELAEDTLARSRQILGHCHPITLKTAGNVAIVLFSSGNRIGARNLMQHTLAGYKQTFGEHHPETRRTAQSLDQIVGALGGRPKTGSTARGKKQRR
jgi:TIR domain/Tetratricopeptide repeat/NB-ARC domain